MAALAIITATAFINVANYDDVLAVVHAHASKKSESVL